jgi:aryl carrier-like protein
MTTDPVQASIASAWCEVLGLDAVDAEDDFFELGGTSVSASLLARRLRGHGIRFTLGELFANPVLSMQARLAAQRADPVT